MCVPYLIEINPKPRKKPACVRPVPSQAGRTPSEKCSPPPCIITIEPRSPRSPKGSSSSDKGGIHVRGQASPKGLALQIEREEQPCDKDQPPPKQKPSPQCPPPNTAASHSPRKARSRSSSSSSSSSSISTRSFRELKEKVELLFRRVTNLEKELNADRSRANRNLWVAAERDSKIGREISGLKDAVGGLNQDMNLLRKDLYSRDRKDAGGQWENGGNEGRVRVRWERTKSSPRGTGY
ncbi:MAG: hypothetical protein LQ338_007016 [Usnochroma carphineum]|nr:MAG: hypothetical protein LQ338_007016 [Usnochroma carphineum]